MKISEVAKHSGVTAKTIRYYESSGLIKAASRGDNGYREYSQQDIQILRFIHRARNLGFPVTEVAKLLALWDNKGRSSADVKALAAEQLANIEARIDELHSIQQTLQKLMHSCHGDQRPDCPILENLSHL